MGKAENAGYQHFLNVFKRLMSQGRLKSGLCGKEFPHSHMMTPFDASGKQAFENIVGKGEKVVVLSNFHKLGEKDKECVWEWLVNMDLVILC